METNKKNDESHWRDWVESDYLASWDFQQDKESLTIKEVKNEIANLQKKEKKVIAYFEESHLSCGTKVKPMILNNTNLKFLQDRSGLRHQKLWGGLKVEISVMDNNSKIGGKKKLVITNLSAAKPFDVSEITSINDYTKAKELASQNSGRMSLDQIEAVKKHLETLKQK